jgi:hypothetical protein
VADSPRAMPRLASALTAPTITVQAPPNAVPTTIT